MFKFSNFQINKTKTDNKDSIFICNYKETELEVVKVFEFESELQRMSVIARMNNEYYVFTKGSPEMIQSLSLNSTVPKEY